MRGRLLEVLAFGAGAGAAVPVQAQQAPRAFVFDAYRCNRADEPRADSLMLKYTATIYEEAP